MPWMKQVTSWVLPGFPGSASVGFCKVQQNKATAVVVRRRPLLLCRKKLQFNTHVDGLVCFQQQGAAVGVCPLREGVTVDGHRGEALAIDQLDGL